MPVKDQQSRWPDDSKLKSTDKGFSAAANDMLLEERIAVLERKLQKQNYRLSVLQHLAGFFATMPKPDQIAKTLLELFCRETHVQTSAIWLRVRGANVYKPYTGFGLNKDTWSKWELPAPNPFLHASMLLLHQGWLEKQAVLPTMAPLMGPGGNLALHYLPFEYNSLLMGFAIIGIESGHLIDDDLDTLALLGRQVASSLFNLYLFLDLSDQRDELKRKSLDLERANDTLLKMDSFKNEFLIITSHELRTPLTGVLGFIKLVLDGMYENEEEMRLMLQDSYSSGKRLLKLLNDILDLAKIESGHLELDLKPVSVQDSFAEIKSIAQSIPKEPGVTINWPEGLDSLPNILADPDRFNQILVNLLSNALKFTLKGSVSVVVEREIGFISFSVIDTGIGISPEARTNLFQKFVQAYSGRTRGFSGTGLGLVISKELAEIMGGAIDLQSDGEGCGSTARFTIPIA